MAAALRTRSAKLPVKGRYVVLAAEVHVSFSDKVRPAPAAVAPIPVGERMKRPPVGSRAEAHIGEVVDTEETKR
jgi:hypothetical protein